MVKKEFTKEVQKRLDNLSDVELIEELDGTTYGAGEVYRDIIRALLDKRLKITIQDLTKNVKKFNKKSSCYTKILIWLTAIMTLAVLAQIYLLIK